MVVQVDEQAASAAPQSSPSPLPPPASSDVQLARPTELAPAGSADSNTAISPDTQQLTSSEGECSRADTTSLMPSDASAQLEAEDAADAEEDNGWSNSAPMLPHELITDPASPSPSDHLPDLLEENETELDDDHEHGTAHYPAASLNDERVLPHGQITFSFDPPTPTDAPMEMPNEDVSKLVLGPALDDIPLHTEGDETDAGSPQLAPTGSDGLVTEFLDNILHADEDENTRVEHAPLFAYECMSGCEEGTVRPAGSFPIHDPLPVGTPLRVDIDASALEEFPSDAQRVFEFIEEAKARLSEDITSEDDSRLSTPVHMPATPVDTYFSHRLSPKGEQAQHLAQIPEECVLPDLAMDVPSPSGVAFHVQSSDGILLDQDGLFDVPRRISSCRRASNDWSDARPSPPARDSSGSIAEVDGTQDQKIAMPAKQATGGEEERLSSSTSSGDLTSPMSVSDEAVHNQKPSASAPPQSDEPASHSVSSLPKAVVSFRQDDVTASWKLAQFDGVYDLLRGLRGSVQRPG
jgi:hypothetical protein